MGLVRRWQRRWRACLGGGERPGEAHEAAAAMRVASGVEAAVEAVARRADVEVAAGVAPFQCQCLQLACPYRLYHSRRVLAPFDAYAYCPRALRAQRQDLQRRRTEEGCRRLTRPV